MADIEKIDNSIENDATKSSTSSSNISNTITNNNNNNNWWGSWINSAKTKSASVLEAVKRDLDEISTAVRTEVSNAGSVIGETLKLDEPESTASNVKKSLSTFFGQVSEALAPTLDDDDAEAVLITSDGIITLTGFQKHLAELQANEATFLAPPDDTLTENYQRWLEIVEQDQFTQNQLAKHLTNSEILNEKYLNLVPEKVSHMEFWKRYLFKRALLEDALANAETAERRAKAEIRSNETVSPKRAAEIIQTEQPKTVIDTVTDTATINEPDAEVEEAKPAVEEVVVEDTNIKWEAEDFGTEEISEEEQARLLEEYEAEIQEREKRKSLIIPLEEKLHSNGDNRDTAQDLKVQPSAKKVIPSKLQQSGKKQQQPTSGGNKKQANTSKQIDTTKVKPTTSNTSDSTKSTSTNNKNSNKNTKNTNNNINNNNSNTNTSSNDTKTTDDDDQTLKIAKNHFTKDAQVKCTGEDRKTDTGSASDESWEKDFDLSD